MKNLILVAFVFTYYFVGRVGLGLSHSSVSILLYKIILRTSAVSSTNLGSILIFASCVIGTCNVLLLLCFPTLQSLVSRKHHRYYVLRSVLCTQENDRFQVSSISRREIEAYPVPTWYGTEDASKHRTNSAHCNYAHSVCERHRLFHGNNQKRVYRSVSCQKKGTL